MGSRIRIRSMENFFPNIDFEYVFLDLTKNSKSGSHMIGTASLAPIWSNEFSTRDLFRIRSILKRWQAFHFNLMQHKSASELDLTWKPGGGLECNLTGRCPRVSTTRLGKKFAF